MSNSDPDDLFKAEIADVKPLKPNARANLGTPKPKPIAIKRIEDDRELLKGLLTDTSGWDADIETGDLITFLRNGIPADVLRKLKRGKWVTQDSLDLHGENIASAREQLALFIAHARQQGFRCVRIVHGKGYRSPNQSPVLRNKVRLSLSQRDQVLAFCDAAPADGGSGAVLVLLKGS